MSGAFDRPIPAAIPPFTENEEKTVICAVFTELNEKFCVGLDNPPFFTQHLGPAYRAQQWEDGVFLGAQSRENRKSRRRKRNVDLTASGWYPKPGNIKKLWKFSKI